MMIWSILNWRILSDDEIKTLYENKAQETGYMTHRSAAECMQRLVRRGLVAEGEGELGADALFNLLSGLYVVPISESPILRLISFIRLTVFEHIPYAVTKQIFRRDKRNSDEQKVMLLANQAMLSTAEMIKCAELNTFAFDSEDELIDTLYHDEYTTSENIAHSVRFLPQCRPVITSVANLYLRKQIILKDVSHGSNKRRTGAAQAEAVPYRDHRSRMPADWCFNVFHTEGPDHAVSEPCGIVASAGRALSYYRIITDKSYETVEGVCVSVVPKPLRKYRKIKLWTATVTSLLCCSVSNQR